VSPIWPRLIEFSESNERSPARVLGSSDDFFALAQQEKRREDSLSPRRSLIQGTINPARLGLSYGDTGIWLIDENTQSGWRMIV
jgi:hypothetical protein